MLLNLGNEITPTFCNSVQKLSNHNGSLQIGFHINIHVKKPYKLYIVNP
jgi:hypothetical protein